MEIGFTFETGFRKRASGYAPDGKTLPGRIYTPGKLSQKQIDNIRRKFDAYKIVYKNGKVSGPPIFMVRQSEAYEHDSHWNKDMFTRLGMEMKAYFDLMKTIAVAYHNAQDAQVKQEMRQKFMAMYDHITDQGVAYGSCWGNIHHYGYSVRSLYLSLFPDEGCAS